MFEPKKFDAIVEEMRDRTPSTLTDFEAGSVVRTLYESFSFELALLYEQMERVYLSGFVDTATGTQLDMVVAILGLKRSEPDYATGEVTFIRDLGIDEVIEIPAGFLITTAEDTEETPKKAFETIESALLLETQTQTAVRVQAVHRGETEAAAAETITVMPQPLSGIKEVINELPVRFVGKQRETDEELRNRAKTALLAASGANITAIENALFSMPGVTEVRVREKFHYARGKVTISKSDRRRKGAVTLPKGTVLNVAGKRQFVTLSGVTLAGDTPEKRVEVEAKTRGLAGQVTAEENVTWSDISAALDDPTAGNAEPVAIKVALSDEPVVLRDFGVVDVYVDGVDFGNEASAIALQKEIDRVRAAGIYVLLKPAQTVSVDAIFQIELVPGKRISTEERLALEAALQQDITVYLTDQRMGQPLLMSQLTKHLLEPALANDLVEFKLTTYQNENGFLVPTQHPSNAKRIEVEVLERIAPRHIRVASEIKPLLVDVQVKVGSLGEPADKAETQRQIGQRILDYFSQLSAGNPIIRTELVEGLEDLQSEDVEIKLVPYFWHSPSAFDGHTVDVSFVEQAQLGNLFIYETRLEINGALKLMVSLTATQSEKNSIQNGVQLAIEDYFDQLKPEEGVDITRMAEIAGQVEGVLQVDWRPEDFQTFLDRQGAKTLVENRIDGTTIQVAAFEKTRLMPNFAISTDILTVPVKVQALTLRLDILGSLPAEIEIERLKATKEAKETKETKEITSKIQAAEASVKKLKVALKVVMEKAVRHVLGNIHTELTQPMVGTRLESEAFENDLRSQLKTRANSLSRSQIATFGTDIDNSLAELTKNLLQGAAYTFETLTLDPDPAISAIRLSEQAKIQPIDLAEVTVKIELPVPQPPS